MRVRLMDRRRGASIRGPSGVGDGIRNRNGDGIGNEDRE
jgi:hypothetical protein